MQVATKLAAVSGAVIVVTGTTLLFVARKLGLFRQVVWQEAQMDELEFVYVEHQGAYQNIGAAFEQLTNELAEKGVSITQHSHTFVGLYKDDPGKVPPEKLSSLAGVVLDAETTQKCGLPSKKFESQTTLQTVFPYYGLLSIMLAVYKCYPALAKACGDDGEDKYGECIELWEPSASTLSMRWARLQTRNVLASPLPALTRARVLSRCKAEFDDRLISAESAGDAVVALEVLAEASAVKATIAPAAAEAGARALCELSAQRALKAIQQHVLDKGEQPCFKSTIPTLSKALAKAEDKDGFEALLEAVEPHLLSVCVPESEESEHTMEDQHDCMRCMNLMLRMQGKVDIDSAVEKVNRYHKMGIIIEGSTYSQLAASSLTAGNFPQAEELLEMRDYL